METQRNLPAIDTDVAGRRYSIGARALIIRNDTNAREAETMMRRLGLLHERKLADVVVMAICANNVILPIRAGNQPDWVSGI